MSEIDNLIAELDIIGVGTSVGCDIALNPNQLCIPVSRSLSPKALGDEAIDSVLVGFVQPITSLPVFPL
ncbi:MAG: hypothetical protein AAB305_00510 [Candidatus Zixiibacteriota bacterium]